MKSAFPKKCARRCLQGQKALSLRKASSSRNTREAHPQARGGSGVTLEIALAIQIRALSRILRAVA